MDLKEIVAIGGISGLHKIIGRSKSGLILETMTEPKKRFSTGIHDKVSVLEDISMYTEDGDVALAEVFVKLNANGASTVTSKDDAKAQRAYVNTVVKLDNDRVYDSDIKKLITWYNLLKDQLDFTQLANKDVANEKGTNVAEDTTEPGDDKVKRAAVKKATTSKVPKNAAPKDMTPKVSSKGAGNKNTYRPKSV